MTARSNMMRLFRAYCSQQNDLNNQLIEDNQPLRIRAHGVHKCIATVFGPNVVSGQRADTPRVELGEQRVKREIQSRFRLIK